MKSLNNFQSLTCKVTNENRVFIPIHILMSIRGSSHFLASLILLSFDKGKYPISQNKNSEYH